MTSLLSLPPCPFLTLPRFIASYEDAGGSHLRRLNELIQNISQIRFPPVSSPLAALFRWNGNGIERAPAIDLSPLPLPPVALFGEDFGSVETLWRWKGRGDRDGMLVPLLLHFPLPPCAVLLRLLCPLLLLLLSGLLLLGTMCGISREITILLLSVLLAPHG
jgi:hypothetical protein